ncbi:hypothetical protein B0O80DRAFT_445531 [Mortierella sp. GBAus27b]|nr:hypothetical protein B0O80DRAFT_445531 [Mortierella sp. GBAus27b]
MLQTLVWTTPGYMTFPQDEFYNFFAATTWPKLDSIAINNREHYVRDEEYAAILLAAKRPFKVLDLDLYRLEPPTFDLLRRDHFETLTRVNLSIGRHDIAGLPDFNEMGDPSWVQEVLESCPSLEQIVARTITAKRIINGKPWVCLGLKVFKVRINMEFENKSSQRGPTRPKFTKDEERACHQVFTHLSQLKQLKVLDMSRWGGTKCANLPLELRMGLGQLFTLRNMETVVHREPQDFRMVDVEWMLRHWPRLKTVSGGRLSRKCSKTFGDTLVRDYLLMRALHSKGVQTPRRWPDDDSHVILYMYREKIAQVYDSDSEGDSGSE